MELPVADPIRTDFLCSVGMAIVTFSIMAVYTGRVLFAGPTEYERVERQGRSRIVPRRFMEGFYWLVQPVGNMLHRLGISANMVTAGSLVFGTAAGISLASGFFGLACILATIGGMGDTLDGLLARKSGKISSTGSLLDSTIDRYVDFSLLFGLAMYYRPLPLALFLTLMAILGTFMVSYSSMMAEARRLQPPRGSMKRIERYALLTIGSGLVPFSIRWLERPTEAGIHAAYPVLAAIVAIAVFANYSAIARVAAMARMLGGSREQEDAPSPLPPLGGNELRQR